MCESLQYIAEFVVSTTFVKIGLLDVLQSVPALNKYLVVYVFAIVYPFLVDVL